MTVAGTRQRSPGTQQRTVKISVATMLVRKAYFGRLVAFPVRVCCVTPAGWVRTICVYSVCTRRDEYGVKDRGWRVEVNKVTSVRCVIFLLTG